MTNNKPTKTVNEELHQEDEFEMPTGHNAWWLNRELYREDTPKTFGTLDFSEGES